jgi:3',5'-cyclic-nucleotide phosphodiesterase
LSVGRLIVEKKDCVMSGKTLGVPVLGTSSDVIGVLEVFKPRANDFSERDVSILRVFATFAGMAFEHAGAPPAPAPSAAVDELEQAMSRDMTPEERQGYAIPEKLKLNDEQIATLSSMNCFSPDFRGLTHFKELFHFFDHFHFLEKFHITAERFYKFIYRISSKYTHTFYHNFTHACDVTQCIFFQVTVGKVGSQYEDWELFALFVAAICHDTNHRGLNNVYNVKAETPLGILFKDMSVMEMWHISQSIPDVDADDINLFGFFEPARQVQLWRLFTQLILATDMAHHFELVKKAGAALDENKFDFTNPEFRLLGLQLLLKVGDISNVSRPFPLAEKWCEILDNEFFHQGDLEKKSSFGLTSPLDDRDNSNRPKSQASFYKLICLPIYQTVARLYPPLQVNVYSINSNLAEWQKRIAAGKTQ